MTAAAASTQPAKKPNSKWRTPLNRWALFSIIDSSRERDSRSASTAFVKLPVMTAVEGATGKVRRKRANCQPIADTAIIAAIEALRPRGSADGLVVILKINTEVISRN